MRTVAEAIWCVCALLPTRARVCFVRAPVFETDSPERVVHTLQADEEQQKKSRSFRKFTYRGVDLDQLLDLNPDELVQLFHARARRRYVCWRSLAGTEALGFWVQCSSALAAPRPGACTLHALRTRLAVCRCNDTRADAASSPRSFQRGLKRKSLTLIKKLRKAVRHAFHCVAVIFATNHRGGSCARKCTGVTPRHVVRHCRRRQRPLVRSRRLCAHTCATWSSCRR